jgi:hypothetical protein
MATMTAPIPLTRGLVPGSRRDRVPGLRIALVSLRRLSERAHLLDEAAEGRVPVVAELLSAACQLQLDLQSVPLSAPARRSRQLARELCSALSQLAPGRAPDVQGVRQLVREIEELLDEEPRTS